MRAGLSRVMLHLLCAAFAGGGFFSLAQTQTGTASAGADSSSGTGQQTVVDGKDGVQPKRVGGGVSFPVLLHHVEPEFSDQARRAKVQGTVLVNLWVDEKGRPSHVRVLRGVGSGLDENAVKAVQQYKFKPAMEGGKPVLVEVNVVVSFQMF
jgi:protein TonB